MKRRKKPIGRVPIKTARKKPLKQYPQNKKKEKKAPGTITPKSVTAESKKSAPRPANNTTCDIYHAGNAPPAAPSEAAVAFHLAARFHPAAESSEGDQDFRWTHTGYFAKGTDIRDAWPLAATSYLYVADKNGSKFAIVFVELVNRGLPTEYKRVYLDRQAITWPSDQL